MKPEKKVVDLSENEKAIFENSKKRKYTPSKRFKERNQAGLSNKGWDKGDEGPNKAGSMEGL